MSCTPGPAAYSIRPTDDPNHNARGVEYQAGLKGAGTAGFLGCENNDDTRWAVMAKCVEGSTTVERYSMLNYFTGQHYVPMNQAHGDPRAEAHVTVLATRGYLGSEEKQYNAVPETYEIHAPYTMNDITPNLKYELNVLLEYSNSQVLMSKTREIPIHVSNLVPKN